MDEQQTASSPPPGNTTPVPQLKNQTKWWHILIGVVIGMALLAGGFVVYNAYFAKPSETPSVTTKTATESAKESPAATPAATKDETADWKTYIHYENYYSIKYPPSFRQEGPDKKANHFVIYFYSEDYEETEPSGFGYVKNGMAVSVSERLRVDEVSNSEDLEGWVKKDSTAKSNMGYVSYNNLKSYRYDYSPGSISHGSDQTVTHFVHDGYVFSVTLYHSESGNKQKNLETYNQMLSTFKFLD